MQAVRLDILKNPSDPRCSRLYDRLLANQSQWSRRYPPSVEHACAATVVEANPPEPATQSTSIESTSGRRKRIVNLIVEIDTESQLTFTLATLRQLAVQCRWLEWTDAMHSDLSWRRLIHGFLDLMDDGELRFNKGNHQLTHCQHQTTCVDGDKAIDPACPLCGRPATLRHIPCELVQHSVTPRALHLATSRCPSSVKSAI